MLQYSSTVSLRLAGFEDEDDDEYENEAPCEGGHFLDMFQGLKPLAHSLGPFGTKTRTPATLSTPHQNRIFEHEDDQSPITSHVDATIKFHSADC